MPGRANVNASSGGASKVKANKSGQKITAGQSQRNLTAKQKAAPTKTKLNATQQAELEFRLFKKPEAQGAAVNIQKHVRGRLAANRVETLQANQQQQPSNAYNGGRGSNANALPKPKLNAKQQAELDARLAYKPEAQEAAVDIQKHVRGLLASDRVEIVRANHQQAMTGCGDGYGNGDGSSGGAGGGNNSSSGTSRSRRPPAHTFHPPAKRFHGSNLPRLSQEGRGDGGRGEQQLGVEAEERRLSEVSERALQLAGYQSKKPASPSDEPRVPRYHMEEGRMLLEELALLNAKAFRQQASLATVVVGLNQALTSSPVPMDASPVAATGDFQRSSSGGNFNAGDGTFGAHGGNRSRGVHGGKSSPKSKEVSSAPTSAPIRTTAGEGGSEAASAYQTILQEKLELEAQVVRLQGLIASIRSPNNHTTNHTTNSASQASNGSATAARHLSGGGSTAGVLTPKEGGVEEGAGRRDTIVSNAIADDREEWEKKGDLLPSSPSPPPKSTPSSSSNPPPLPPPGHMATLRALQDANVAAEKEAAYYRRKCEELEEAMASGTNAIGSTTTTSATSRNSGADRERLKARIQSLEASLAEANQTIADAFASSKSRNTESQDEREDDKTARIEALEAFNKRLFKKVEDLSEALAKERQNSVNAHSAVVVAAANAAQAAASNARDPTPTVQAHPTSQLPSTQGHSSQSSQQQQHTSSSSAPLLMPSRSTSKVTFEIDASDDGDLSEEEMNYNGASTQIATLKARVSELETANQRLLHERKNLNSSPPPSNTSSSSNAPPPPPGHMATLCALQDANVAAEKEAEALRSQVRDLQNQLDDYSSSVGHQSKARRNDGSGNSRDQDRERSTSSSLNEARAQVQHLTLAREALASAFAKSQSSNAELQERLRALEREQLAKKQQNHQSLSSSSSSSSRAQGSSGNGGGAGGSGLLSELLAEANELQVTDNSISSPRTSSASTRGAANGSSSSSHDLAEKTKSLEQRLSQVKQEATDAARAAASREAMLRKKLVSIEAENDLLHEEAEVLEAAVVQAERGGNGNGKGDRGGKGGDAAGESIASMKATTAEATKRALELARALNKATFEKEQTKKELVETQTLARSLHTRLVTAQRQNRMPATKPPAANNAAVIANSQGNASGHVNGVHDLRPLVQALSRRNEQLEVELARVANRPLPPGASLSDFQNGEVYAAAASSSDRKLTTSTSGVGSYGGGGPPLRSNYGQIEEYRSSDGQQVHIGGSVNAGLGGFEGGNGNGNGYLLADHGHSSNGNQYGTTRGSGDGVLVDKREYIAAVAALKADRRRFQQEVQQQKRDGVDVLKLRVENDQLRVAMSGHKNSLERLIAESARKVEMVERRLTFELDEAKRAHSAVVARHNEKVAAMEETVSDLHQTVRRLEQRAFAAEREAREVAAEFRAAAAVGLDADRLRSDLDRASRAAEASEAARIKFEQATANQVAELQKKADEKVATAVAAAETAKKEASDRELALEQELEKAHADATSLLSTGLQDVKLAEAKALKAQTAADAAQDLLKETHEELMHEREAHQATASQLKMAKTEAKAHVSAVEDATAALKAEANAEKEKLTFRVNELRSVVEKLAALVVPLTAASGEETPDMVRALVGDGTLEPNRLIDASPLRQDASNEEQHVRKQVLEHVHRVRSAEVSELSEALSKTQHTLGLTAAKLQSTEEERRALHNRLQEYRGNIRVMVRVRPFLETHDAEVWNALERNGLDPSSATPFRFLDDQASLSVINPLADLQRLRNGADNGGNGSLSASAVAMAHDNTSDLENDPTRLTFKFDKVFSPSCGQNEIFDEVRDFVTSALDGYQVCLFSYGQTGSGKTHTMVGTRAGPAQGIIPRAVEQILQVATAANREMLQASGGKGGVKTVYAMQAGFLEIYNEQLRDLLGDLRSSQAGGDATPLSEGSSPTSPNLAIKSTKTSNGQIETTVSGQHFFDIWLHGTEEEDLTTGRNQLAEVMRVAAKARSVAATSMNAQSSRSHTIFTLRLQCTQSVPNGKGGVNKTVRRGTLNLCDLAGSERLDRSHANDNKERLRETQAINKSLSTLGSVFSALSRGDGHVPFRDSKLTQLLQGCLSGNGKALMLVCLSPTIASIGESVQSLRFAKRVTQVELGRPVAASSIRALPDFQTRSPADDYYNNDDYDDDDDDGDGDGGGYDNNRKGGGIPWHGSSSGASSKSRGRGHTSGSGGVNSSKSEKFVLGHGPSSSRSSGPSVRRLPSHHDSSNGGGGGGARQNHSTWGGLASGGGPRRTGSYRASSADDALGRGSGRY